MFTKTSTPGGSGAATPTVRRHANVAIAVGRGSKAGRSLRDLLTRPKERGGSTTPNPQR